MRFYPKSSVKRVVLGVTIIAVGLLAWSVIREMDTFFWPQSGNERIEWMASHIRSVGRRTTWCDPSNNPENIYEFSRTEEKEDIGKCLSTIVPVSDFEKGYEGHYIKRFYRAEVGDKFCEVTLSTFHGNDRIVGSDCYFGLFPKAKDTGIGMTDDKFG